MRRELLQELSRKMDNSSVPVDRLANEPGLGLLALSYEFGTLPRTIIEHEGPGDLREPLLNIATAALLWLEALDSADGDVEENGIALLKYGESDGGT